MSLPSNIDKALAYLGVIDPASSVIEEQSEHGTLALCEWIRSTKEYKSVINWNAKDIKDSDSKENNTDDVTSRVLMIRGGPEVDKTALMEAIVRHLSSEATLEKSNVSKDDSKAISWALSYYSCGRISQGMDNSASVLRSLIHSLLRQQPELISHLEEVQDNTGRNNFGSAKDFLALSAIFFRVLYDKKFVRSYLVIDGIDKCSSGHGADGHNLGDLMRLIKATATVPHKIKWLLSADVDDHVEFDLIRERHYLCINLEQDSWTPDLAGIFHRNVLFTVRQLADQKRYTKQIKNEVLRLISDKSRGNALWTAIACALLQRQDSRHGVEALKEMPETLDELYEYMMAKFMLENLSEQDNEDHITEILLTMTAVYRPLLVSELVRLAELPSQIESLPIIEKCLLLEVQSGIIKFINPAAEQVTRQKLHEDATVFPQVHSLIAKKSLKFLSAHFKIAALCFPGLNLGPSQSEKERLPGAYGTLHWIMHLINVKDIVEDDEMVDLVVSFMKNHFLLWLDTLASEGLHADAAILMKRLESVLLEQQREEKSEQLKTQDFDQSERQRLEQLGENKQSHILSLVRDGVQLLRLHTSENSLSRKHPSSAIFYPEESALKQDWMAKNKDWLVKPPRMTHSWSNIPFTLNASDCNSIAFSPDGRLLATGSSSGICLWDAETGAAQLKNEHEFVRNWGDYLAFSAGGQLASASKNRTVELWDLSTGRSLKTFQVEQGNITAIRFSPNGDEGEKLVLATSDALLLWKFSDFGKPTYTYTEEVIEEEGHVSAVDFSQQGTWIASGAAGGDIKIWDARHGNALHKTIQGHKERINSVAFSRDEKRLVSGSGDLTVKIWSVETGANLNSFDCELAICGLAFSPDGLFIAAGFGNEVKVWESETGVQRSVMRGHKEPVTAVAFLPQGRLASGSCDTTIQLWDFEGSVRNDTNALSDSTSSWPIRHITMSPDGKYLASTSGKNIHLRDGTTGMPMESNELLQDRVTSISFSPDGKRLVSSSEDGLVRVWDVVEGSLYRNFEGHSQPVTFATFSPDGNSIASVSYDNTVRIWSCLPEAEGGDAIVLKGHEDRVTTVAFSPDGGLLVSVSWGSNIIVWDCKSRRPKYSVTGQSGIITTIVFSQDSSRIVSRSTDHTLYVWDSNTGDLIQGPINIRRPGRNVGFDSRMPEYILTEYGADPSTLEHSPFLVEECQKGGRYGVALGNDWITWNGREIISIPKMYKPTASWVQGSIVAIGTRSGEVLLFRFSTEVEPPN